MKKAEAQHHLAQAARGRTPVGFTQHFWEKVGECAPGLTRNEVYGLLRRGRMVGAPLRKNDYLCHEVKVRAETADFGLLEMVVDITARETLICVTIYGIPPDGEV